MAIELKAEIREEFGKKLKALREKGFIPAIVYGPGHKSIAIRINMKDFKRVFKEAGESTLIRLKIGDQVKNVLIHDIAMDVVNDIPLHVDFYQVALNKMLKTKVPLVFEGEAPAVKTLDGVLVKNLTEVEIEALPKDLPREIKVDISGIDSFDKHIRVKDLNLPPGVKILEEKEEVVVTVIPPRTEAELKALEEKPEEKVEEIEVVGEKTEKIKEEGAEEDKENVQQ